MSGHRASEPYITRNVVPAQAETQVAARFAAPEWMLRIGKRAGFRPGPE